MAMGRPLPPLTLDDTERETLERWARRPKTAQALALRDRIILSGADGLDNTAVSVQLGVSKQTVGKWRSRFLKQRLDGLLDEPRSGRPRAVTDADVERFLALTLEIRPRDATHWSTRSMVQRSGLSHSTVSRIWRAFGLQPHRTETFKLSSDPFFIEKVSDVVGLYLNPPDRALVLCVDEKSQIQALDCTRPLLPIRPDRVERRTRDYLRHGTTSLFAALDTRTGKVIVRCHQRHRAVEFRKFLDTQNARYHRGGSARRPGRPPDRGQLRYRQDGAGPELVCPAAPVPSALHAHQRFLAEPGGALVCAADRETTPPRRASEQRGIGGRHLRLPGRYQRGSQALCLDQDRRPDPIQRGPLLPTHFGYRILGSDQDPRDPVCNIDCAWVA